MLAKFSNSSKCHSCEPKIVPELLIPVTDNNELLVILWINLDIKSPHYKIWLKSAIYVHEFNCLQCRLAKLIDYHLYPKYIFEQAFCRLILLIEKNEKINILSVPFINLNFPPSSGAKKQVQMNGILTISPMQHLLSVWVKHTFS